MRYTTDIWGFGAFICQLIAILELAYGLRIAMLAQNRKKSYRLTPVSYTHLDVYKRQVWSGGKSGDNFKGLPIAIRR